MFTDGALMYIAMDWAIFCMLFSFNNWHQGVIAILNKVSVWITLGRPLRTIEWQKYKAQQNGVHILWDALQLVAITPTRLCIHGKLMWYSDVSSIAIWYMQNLSGLSKVTDVSYTTPTVYEWNTYFGTHVVIDTSTALWCSIQTSQIKRYGLLL